jgi:GntR family transcriptional regulator of vanillate catabolism
MYQLQGLILSGELAPGERVTEIGLAERLNVSRTPIRNLLPRLAAEGYLEPFGRRGFKVKSFSEDESLRALDIRGLLEGFAARIVAERGCHPEIMAQLEECLAAGDQLFEKRHIDLADEAEYGTINGRFHSLIVEAADTPLLKSCLDRVNIVPFVSPKLIVFDNVSERRAFDLLFRAHGVHHSIVDAIKKGDGSRAEMLFREHIQSQRESMFSRREADVVAETSIRGGSKRKSPKRLRERGTVQ